MESRWLMLGIALLLVHTALEVWAQWLGTHHDQKISNGQAFVVRSYSRWEICVTGPLKEEFFFFLGPFCVALPFLDGYHWELLLVAAGTSYVWTHDDGHGHYDELARLDAFLYGCLKGIVFVCMLEAFPSPWGIVAGYGATSASHMVANSLRYWANLKILERQSDTMALSHDEFQ